MRLSVTQDVLDSKSDGEACDCDGKHDRGRRKGRGIAKGNQHWFNRSLDIRTLYQIDH